MRSHARRAPLCLGRLQRFDSRDVQGLSCPGTGSWGGPCASVRVRARGRVRARLCVRVRLRPRARPRPPRGKRRHNPSPPPPSPSSATGASAKTSTTSAASQAWPWSRQAPRRRRRRPGKGSAREPRHGPGRSRGACRGRRTPTRGSGARAKSRGREPAAGPWRRGPLCTAGVGRPGPLASCRAFGAPPTRLPGRKRGASRSGRRARVLVVRGRLRAGRQEDEAAGTAHAGVLAVVTAPRLVRLRARLQGAPALGPVVRRAEDLLSRVTVEAVRVRVAVGLPRQPHAPGVEVGPREGVEAVGGGERR